MKTITNVKTVSCDHVVRERGYDCRFMNEHNNMIMDEKNVRRLELGVFEMGINHDFGTMTRFEVTFKQPSTCVINEVDYRKHLTCI